MLTTIVNCFKGTGDTLQRGNYRRLKLTDQNLKVVERVIEKVDKMRCSLVSCQDAVFIVIQLQEKY